MTRHYPDYHLTRTHPGTGLLDFANTGSLRAKADKHLSFYADRERDNYDNESQSLFKLKDDISFGRLSCTWNGTDFFIYVAELFRGDYTIERHFVLWPRGESEGDSPARQVDNFLLASLQHRKRVHDEIWLYYDGVWEKNKRLFNSVKGSRWEDAILDDGLKTELMNDVVNFYARKEHYKSFGVPWKVSCHTIPDTTH